MEDRIKKEAITLDGFTMMNLTYAKSVFSEKNNMFSNVISFERVEY